MTFLSSLHADVRCKGTLYPKEAIRLFLGVKVYSYVDLYFPVSVEHARLPVQVDSLQKQLTETRAQLAAVTAVPVVDQHVIPRTTRGPVPQQASVKHAAELSRQCSLAPQAGSAVNSGASHKRSTVCAIS